MSISWCDRPDAKSVESTPAPRRIRGTAPAPIPRDPVHLIAMQRLVGNRATSALVAVQRCGSLPADQCPCQDENGATKDAGSSPERADPEPATG